MNPYDNLLDFIRLVHPNVKLSKMHYDMIDMIQTTANPYPSTPLDICEDKCSAPCKKTCWPSKKPKQEEVNPMASYASAQIIADTTEKDQRRHASNRIYSIYESKKDALRKQFGLTDDAAPETAADFIKRIQDGKYTVDKEKMDKKTYGPERYIRWRDPSRVEDNAGYEAAKALLKAAYTKAEDKIALGAATDLLAAVETFDGWSLS